jgi:hypothetical protein
VDCIERDAEIVSDGNASFGFIKNSGEQRKTAEAPLLFRRSIDQKPRISAENERAPADNFMEEQRKTAGSVSDAPHRLRCLPRRVPPDMYRWRGLTGCSPQLYQEIPLLICCK